MYIVRDLRHIKRFESGCVLTIGNFDGVHLGHQAIIQSVRDKAAALGVPAVVMTFDPQPREFFDKVSSAPTRLSHFQDKVHELKRLGVHTVLRVPFNESFSKISAQAFVKTILVQGLNVHTLVVGDDFRFGYQREGDFALLKKMGEQYSFDVQDSPTFELQGERVSSSRIRKALLESKFDLAERLLGRPYSFSGRVVHGEKLGRTLGYPTANIKLPKSLLPVSGIYAVTCDGIEGVASVGTRPTVGGKEHLLEVNLFDFNKEIYGEKLRVTFHAKFRDEENFDSVELMKAQIAKDVQAARAYFKR